MNFLAHIRIANLNDIYSGLASLANYPICMQAGEGGGGGYCSWNNSNNNNNNAGYSQILHK